MGLSYHVVFDLGQSGFQEWLFLIGLGPAIVSGWILIAAQRAQPGFRTKRQITQLAVTAFLALWTAVAFGFPFADYLHLRHAYDTGRYHTVAGTVEHFASTPDGKDEHFTVAGVPFSYAEPEGSSMFHCPQSSGGPIRAGLPVRISYVYGGPFSTNAIIKLEVLSRSPVTYTCAAF